MRERLARLTPWIIALLALAQMYPLVAGNAPLSHDHPVHLFKAAYLWDALLSRGRLRGWSSNWFFGYPVAELDTFLMELWTVAVRGLSLGFGSWEAAYGRSVALAWAFTASSVCVLGRRWFGPLAGFLAAVLWLLDPGAFREGGWTYFVDYGVWGQCLGMGFVFRAVVAFEDLFEVDAPRHALRAIAWTALSLLAHPLDFVLLGVALPLRLAVRAWRNPLAAREVWRAFWASAAGVGVASFWVIPMLVRRSLTTDIGEHGPPLRALAGQLADGLFGPASAWILAAAIAGFVSSVKQRPRTAVFLAVWIAGFGVAASSTWVDLTRIERLAPAFAKVQWERLTVPAKAGVFLFAGEGLALLFAFAHRRPTRSRGITALLACAVMALLAAFAGLCADAASRTAALETTSSAAWWPAYRDAARWLREHRDGRFARVLVWMPLHDHRAMALPLHAGLPVYRVGYTPARQFRYAPQYANEDALRALSVRWVVACAEPPYAGLTLVRTWGAFRLYRYEGWRPERWTMIGPGVVEPGLFGDEHVALRIRGAARDARLRFHVSLHPRWRATLDGNEVPIHGGRTPVATPRKERDYLVEVAAHDGVLRLDFVRRPVDRIADAVTLLTVATVAAAMLRRGRARGA